MPLARTGPVIAPRAIVAVMAATGIAAPNLNLRTGHSLTGCDGGIGRASPGVNPRPARRDEIGGDRERADPPRPTARGLPLEVDELLEHLVGRRDDPAVGLEAALGRDHPGELGREVDV